MAKKLDFKQIEIGCYFIDGKVEDFEYSCFEGEERENLLASYEKNLKRQIQVICKKNKPEKNLAYFVQWEGTCSVDTGRIKEQKSFSMEKTKWKMDLKSFRKLNLRLEIQHNKDLRECENG